MDVFRAIVQLLGGLAMFLYGIEVMGDGLKNSSGAALKRVLEKVTSNTLVGVITGTIVTAVIQSSTATIVLTVALIGAGVLNLKQAVSIVLGANIGTTITAQIVRLMDIEAGDNLLLVLCKPDTLAPIALIVGIILIMFIKKGGAKTVADIFIGFGILFIGLMNMSDSVEPLTQTAAFRNILASLNNSWLGLIFGVVSTVIVQSSSAMVSMIQAIASGGAPISFSMVYPIIMGINIGTCVTTAMVCSVGSSKDAKRTGIVHIVFNVVGTVLFMIVMSILEANNVFDEAFWTRNSDSGLIANFQTLFNLITAIVLLPFTGLLVNLSKMIVKDDEATEPKYSQLHTLDEKLYISPAMALAESTKAVAAMGSLAAENFKLGSQMLQQYDESQVGMIDEVEENLDQFADRADHFLIGLSKSIESEADDRQLDMLMQTVPNFERIGDYATNFVELSQQLKKEETSFSTTAKKELALLSEAVNEILANTVDAFLNNDNEAAKKIEPLEETIDDMVMLLRDRHTKRLKSGECAISSGLIFMEALTYMERASDQCSSIAVMMLARNDDAIMQNHYDYLRDLHTGNDSEYKAEKNRRREQYLAPLKALQ